jgi:hypothetical protein
MVVFTLSGPATQPFPPWTHLHFSETIIQRLKLYSTLVLGGSTDLLELYGLVKTLLSGPVMVFFTLSRCATQPFPPWTHLNFSVMLIQRLYLCSTLVLGGSTDLLELYWRLETLSPLFHIGVGW